MVTPRVVATDLDGTLLRSDGSLSDRTRKVLAGLDDRGVQVVFVTARPPRWLEAVADAVGGHGLAICLNGSCVVEIATGDVSQVHGFDADTLAEVVADLRSALPGIELGLERPSGAVFDPHYTRDHHAPSDAHRSAVEDHLDEPVGKLLARIASMPDEAFFASVEQVIGARAELAYSGAMGLAEMTAPGVSKAAALARWCAAHDVPAGDVWAFGDMPNDLPMLTWAGTSFAVANAHDAVLAAATHVTASNDDDGVARALEVLLTS